MKIKAMIYENSSKVAFFRNFGRMRVATGVLIAMPAVSYANNSELFICLD